MDVIKKLDKDILNIKWANGGRKTSKWCNYYVVKEGDSYYLVEKANILSYVVCVILAPVIAILLSLVLIYKVVEVIVSAVDLSRTPLANVYLTLFTKDKVRTDLIRQKELVLFDDTIDKE